MQQHTTIKRNWQRHLVRCNRAMIRDEFPETPDRCIVFTPFSQDVAAIEFDKDPCVTTWTHGAYIALTNFSAVQDTPDDMIPVVTSVGRMYVDNLSYLAPLSMLKRNANTTIQPYFHHMIQSIVEKVDGGADLLAGLLFDSSGRLRDERLLYSPENTNIDKIRERVLQEWISKGVLISDKSFNAHASHVLNRARMLTKNAINEAPFVSLLGQHSDLLEVTMCMLEIEESKKGKKDATSVHEANVTKTMYFLEVAVSFFRDIAFQGPGLENDIGTVDFCQSKTDRLCQMALEEFWPDFIHESGTAFSIIGDRLALVVGTFPSPGAEFWRLRQMLAFSLFVMSLNGSAIILNSADPFVVDYGKRIFMIHDDFYPQMSSPCPIVRCGNHILVGNGQASMGCPAAFSIKDLPLVAKTDAVDYYETFDFVGAPCCDMACYESAVALAIEGHDIISKDSVKPVTFEGSSLIFICLRDE